MPTKIRKELTFENRKLGIMRMIAKMELTNKEDNTKLGIIYEIVYGVKDEDD